MDTIDLELLKDLPEKSLGYALNQFYKEHDLDVYPMGRYSNYTPSQYFGERTRKLHDILHVVLNCGTDLVGEAKVNAFVLNQTRQPIAFLIVCGVGIKYLFRYPLQFTTLLKEIEVGWQMGAQADSFLAQDWDSLMVLPLAEVKRNFIKGREFIQKINYK